MNQINFVTFANKNYMNTNRIAKQAKEFGFFNKIFQLNEENIPNFIKKHKRFINLNKYGFGLWIWKPKVIYDILLTMNNDDILVYCDAGIYINKKGKERFKFYLEKLKDYELITFCTSDKYKAQQFVKQDAIMSYYPDFNKQWNKLCYAGLMIIRKNVKAVQLINDWLKLCENYNFIDKSNSKKFKEASYYAGNDCDNGLFNLCLAKYKINFNIYPDEVNLYDEEGTQIAHTNKKYNEIDWASLDNIPFQVRRMTPKLGYY